MAPEVLSGKKKATPGSDLFMLGITAYQLLTGYTTEPFGGVEIPKKLLKVCCSFRISRLIYCQILKFMTKTKPRKRPSSVEEVLKMLQSIYFIVMSSEVL